jgi:TRAP-type mannitol/chloroaromatic compound transport system permease small subunit
MQGLKLFIRCVDWVSDRIGSAVSILLPAMTLVLFFEVVARYVFKRPTIWAFDTAIFMFGYCGLLAGAHVMKRNEHINVDLVYGQLSPRGKAILDVFNGALFFFFILLVIVYGWEAAYSSIAFGDRRSTEWAPPIGHYKLMVPLGALLLLLQGLANWIRYLYRALTGKELKV